MKKGLILKKGPRFKIQFFWKLAFIEKVLLDRWMRSTWLKTIQCCWMSQFWKFYFTTLDLPHSIYHTITYDCMFVEPVVQMNKIELHLERPLGQKTSDCGLGCRMLSMGRWLGLLVELNFRLFPVWLNCLIVDHNLWYG